MHAFLIENVRVYFDCLIVFLDRFCEEHEIIRSEHCELQLYLEMTSHNLKLLVHN